MLLQGLSKNQILIELKKHFTEEELDSLQPEKLDEAIEDCETLEDLIDDLDDHFAVEEE